MKRKMGVIGQKINMGFYGKRQRSPAKNGQVVKPQEPTSLNVHVIQSETITTQQHILS